MADHLTPKNLVLLDWNHSNTFVFMNTKNKKYLVIKGCAGLGNRFLTIRDAIIYAKKTNRTIFVDWDDGWHLDKGINSFTEYFEITNVEHITDNKPILDSLRNGASRYPASLTEEDLTHDIYDNFNFTYHKKINPYLFSYCHFLNKTAWAYLFYIGYWYRTKKSVKSTFKRLFTNINPNNKIIYGRFLDRTPREEDIICYADFGSYENTKGMFDNIILKDKLLIPIKEFAEKNNLSSRVAVHVRATDRQPPKSVEKLMEKLQEDFISKGLGIFLSTDNPEIEELFKKRFGDHVVCYPKVMPKMGTDNVGKADFGGIHHWARQQDNNTKQALYEATISDMWLLSMCQYLLWQGGSSYSMMSAELMENKTNIIDWTTIV